MVAYLMDMGYKQGKNDPCVFTHPNTEHVIVLWVDDILSLADNDTARQFYKDLGARFEVKAPEYLTPGPCRRQIFVYEITDGHNDILKRR